MAGTSSIGQRLGLARRAQGYTQTQLATRAGLGLASVKNYERGVTVPRRHALESLADALGVPDGWLRDG